MASSKTRAGGQLRARLLKPDGQKQEGGGVKQVLSASVLCETQTCCHLSRSPPPSGSKVRTNKDPACFLCRSPRADCSWGEGVSGPKK